MLLSGVVLFLISQIGFELIPYGGLILMTVGAILFLFDTNRPTGDEGDPKPGDDEKGSPIR